MMGFAAPIRLLLSRSRWRRAWRDPQWAMEAVARRCRQRFLRQHVSAAAEPPRMVEFDKYRKLGAYHWDYLSTRAEYRQHVEAVCLYATPNGSALDLGCGDGAYMYQDEDRRFKLNVLKRGDMMFQATADTREAARKVADTVLAIVSKK